MPTRREVSRICGSLSLLGLAGCLARDGEGTATPPTSTPTGTPPPTETTPRPTYQPSTTTLRLERIGSDALLDAAVRTPDGLSDDQRETLDELRSSGTTTRRNVVRSDRLAFHDEPFVRLDGAFYRVERELLDERPIAVHRFRVEMQSGAPADAVPFADLSALDQAVFRAALTDEYLESGTPFRGTFPYVFGDADPNASRFVSDDPTAVAYRDDSFTVAFQRTDRTTATDVRYALSEVATSREEFLGHLRETYVRDLSSLSLSADQRELVRRALREGEYREERPLTPAFEAVLDAIDSLPSVPNAGRYVRTEGRLYQVWTEGVEA